VLDDTSRKVLRVLFSLNFFNPQSIDINKLVRLSGRTEQQVKDAVNSLVSERYVEWDKQNNMFKVMRLNKKSS